jgi:hypothetical protein
MKKSEAKRMVGKGWNSLINLLFRVIPGDRIYDIKEKYGTLRISILSDDDIEYDFIIGLEYASSKICEVCGCPGETRDRPWIKTLCDECNKKI